MRVLSASSHDCWAFHLRHLCEPVDGRQMIVSEIQAIWSTRASGHHRRRTKIMNLLYFFGSPRRVAASYDDHKRSSTDIRNLRAIVYLLTRSYKMHGVYGDSAAVMATETRCDVNCRWASIAWRDTHVNAWPIATVWDPLLGVLLLLAGSSLDWWRNRSIVHGEALFGGGVARYWGIQSHTADWLDTNRVTGRDSVEMCAVFVRFPNLKNFVRRKIDCIRRAKRQWMSVKMFVFVSSTPLVGRVNETDIGRLEEMHFPQPCQVQTVYSLLHHQPRCRLPLLSSPHWLQARRVDSTGWRLMK